MKTLVFRKLSLIIPVYNEQATVETVLNQILALDMGLAKELIVINDASTDNTTQILGKFKSEPQVTVLQNEHNLGKSLTVKRGIAQSSGDLVVIQDADLEYDPSDLIAFVSEFQKGDVDIIYGNRFGLKNKVVYRISWLGNKILTLLYSLITGPRAGMWIKDAHVCYKMVRGDIMRELGTKIISTSSFGFDTEITARLARYKINNKHLRLKQIPVHYSPRTNAEGKKLRPLTDGLKALWEMVKFNFLEN